MHDDEHARRSSESDKQPDEQGVQAPPVARRNASKHRANRVLDLRKLILDGETKFSELLGVTLAEIKKRVH